MTGAAEPAPLASLQVEHAALFAGYERYQCALMGCDTATAARELAELTARLTAHAALEDALLMPIFRAAHAQSPREGGAPALFEAEHNKLERLAARLATLLVELGPAPTPAAALAVIEAGFTFKHLLDHHTQREDRVFYPVVSACVAGREAEIWAAIEAWRAAHPADSPPAT